MPRHSTGAKAHSTIQTSRITIGPLRISRHNCIFWGQRACQAISRLISREFLSSYFVKFPSFFFFTNSGVVQRCLVVQRQFSYENQQEARTLFTISISQFLVSFYFT